MCEDSFSITLKSTRISTSQELPPPSVHQDLLSHVNARSMKRDDDKRLIRYLDRAMNPMLSRPAVIDFIDVLLTALN